MANQTYTRIDLDALERMAVELPAGAIGYVPIGPKLFAALIAELRLAREVVRAARDFLPQRTTSGGINREDWDDLEQVIAELDRVK